MAVILPAIESTAKVFLHGPFGSGKTTQAIARVRWLLHQERVRGDSILVLVPQRTLAEPYWAALRQPAAPPGPPVSITTFASLAQQAVQRYWPLIAEDAGCGDAAREPTFLTLETSQYHMARLVDTAIGQGEFDAFRMDRSRIISQILDNMNKAALFGISIDAAYAQLELAAPAGDQRTARLNALRSARNISHRFRSDCLQAALLDYSLQVQIFNEQVLANDWSRTHLFRTYRHLVYDNAEEDSASAQRLVRQWLPALSSALIIVDDDAGYRTFLGADPRGADELAGLAATVLHLPGSQVTSPALADLARQVDRILTLRADGKGALSTARRMFNPPVTGAGAAGEVTAGEPGAVAGDAGLTHAASIISEVFRFYPEMISRTADTIADLVRKEEVPPGEIAVLAPFVSDALRFSLQVALEQRGVSLTTHRPSRPLEAEPAARTLLTLAKLAHPQWGLKPPLSDITQTLASAVPRLDPVRAHLLTEIVYKPRTSELGTFGALVEEKRSRITYAAGGDYDRLRGWLYDYRSGAADLPLDQFFAQLFGELLSQPDFGFHADADAARVASQLVESARKFRWALENDAIAAVPDAGITRYGALGREYVRLAEEGAIAGLYVPGWRAAPDAVFLAPAYTFLLRNRPVEIQFWLDVGSGGWWERLYQPLTQPYVLSPRWPPATAWTDADEYFTNQETLRRLLLGLLRRTRRSVYVAVSDYSESGYEQRGPLLTVINRLPARKIEAA